MHNQIGIRTTSQPIYDGGPQDCCEAPQQQSEIHQSLLRLNDAITDLEKRVGDFMPRLTSVQRQVPTNGKGEQAKKGGVGVDLADRINEAYDRIQRLIGIVHDNGEILDL